MAAVRKVLKRLSCCVAPLPAAAGQLALQISDPHDAKWTMLQVLRSKLCPEPMLPQRQACAPVGRAQAAGAAGLPKLHDAPVDAAAGAKP